MHGSEKVDGAREDAVGIKAVFYPYIPFQKRRSGNRGEWFEQRVRRSGGRVLPVACVRQAASSTTTQRKHYFSYKARRLGPTSRAYPYVYYPYSSFMQRFRSCSSCTYVGEIFVTRFENPKANTGDHLRAPTNEPNAIGLAMRKDQHLSYAMTRLYRAVHRAQHANSSFERVQAARWAHSWNAFIQLGLNELRSSSGSEFSSAQNHEP